MAGRTGEGATNRVRAGALDYGAITNLSHLLHIWLILDLKGFAKLLIRLVAGGGFEPPTFGL